MLELESQLRDAQAAAEEAKRAAEAQQQLQAKALETAMQSLVRLCVVAPTVNVHLGEQTLGCKAPLPQVSDSERDSLWLRGRPTLCCTQHSLRLLQPTNHYFARPWSKVRNRGAGEQGKTAEARRLWKAKILKPEAEQEGGGAASKYWCYRNHVASDAFGD